MTHTQSQDKKKNSESPGIESESLGWKIRTLPTRYGDVLIYIKELNNYRRGLVAQAVRRSPPSAGVPSSRLGSSMWVSWWTKRGLGRFFSGFLPFSPTTNFIPPYLDTHLIHFVSFHQPL